VIRHLSCGYIVRRLDQVERADEKTGRLACFRATNWQPTELSFCAVSADPGAQVRSADDEPRTRCVLTRRTDMPDDETTSVVVRPASTPATRRAQRAEGERPPGDPYEPPPPPADPDDDDDDEKLPKEQAARGTRATLAERKRVQGIYQAVRNGDLPATFAEKFIDNGASVGDVAIAVLTEKARTKPPVSRSVIEVGPDGATRLRDGIVHALLQRIAPDRYPTFVEKIPEARRAELADAARDWHGRTLMEIGRACLEAKGFRLRGVGRMELASYALGLAMPPATYLREGPHSFLTTSDFPSLLASVGRAQLTAGYTIAPRTFPPWTRQATLPDFRPSQLVSLGLGPKFLKIGEHGEYTRGALATALATAQLDKYGRMLAFTREAMVNDDVGLFNRIPALFGNSAAAMESDVVYAILTSNPTMADGQPLFSAAHKNLMVASVIDVKNVALARAAMLAQTSPDGQVLNIAPRFMIVGPAQEVYALQFLAPITIVGAASQVTPSAYQSLQLVVDAHITDNAWYLAASPDQIDTITYFYLEGVPPGPALETREGWDIDGQEYKAREEFAAAALDYRGLVKNPGTLPAMVLASSTPATPAK
jgi:hypothetical protein